ncbi:ROK family protein [Pararhodospirillum oryzae]|uniref:N-acetylglucosamine kinase n=1 Tax=Pararhodospirillum oryzae TaxID=478448 RepID=A0A512HAI8_9PROT|nr:ROK family protein [Pararhodospirillum oryzae]GEO82466.1 N-acetylglucosamine kinase [Pararhodospirillum oryzae]
MDLRLGIDLGGTKIEIIALDPDGTVRVRRRVPTPRGDYDQTLATIAALVAEAEAEVGRRGSVGVGMPGTLDPQTGLVKNANSTWLIGRPFDQDLARVLGRPVRIANDADCLALSEAHDGAGAGAPIVFAVILGTGVGGGLVVNGHLVGGPNAITGEWGHIPLPWPHDDERPGPACYCGRLGCVETFCSGPGMAADHRAHTGQVLDAAEIAARAQAGDGAAQATLERHANRLARALAVVITLLDPHVIVLGGGVGTMPHLTRDLPRLWAPWVFSPQTLTRVAIPRHGDSSGVRGAAWLWS